MTIDSDPASLGEVQDAASVLDAYEAGSSFLFTSAQGTMLARDVEATVPKITRRAALAGQVAEFLRNAQRFGRANPLVVGAVPFSEDLPAHLVLPGDLVRTEPSSRIPAPAGSEPPPEYVLRHLPAPAEYGRNVTRMLRRVDRGDVDRVALARSIECAARGPLDRNRMVRTLAHNNPGGHVFAVDLPRRGQDGTRDTYGPRPPLQRTFLGSSPELLVSRHGTRVRTRPAAGSRPRGDDPAQDRRQANELLKSEEDLREHAAAIEATLECLRPLCKNLHVPGIPAVAGTPMLWHLTTEVSAELRDPATSSLELANALHPTSAVCGAPVEPARAALGETEPFSRGYYAGMVGWCDSAGDGEWVLARQCGEIEDDKLRLYASAEIAAGSVPERELARTSAEFRTMLSAMGWNATA